MPSSRPSEYRKSKWEQQNSSSSNDKSYISSSKPLVEYDNFSSSEEEQTKAKHLNSSDAKRRVVLKAVPTEKLSNFLEKHKSKQEVKSAEVYKRKSTNKSHKSTEQRTSQKHSGRSEYKKEKKEHQHIVSSSKKTSVKKRSRSRSLSSFTSSDFSDDSMDRNIPISHESYNARRYTSTRSSPRDRFKDQDPYISRSHGQTLLRYERSYSPHSNFSHSHVRSKVPLIRRSITPPKHSSHHHSPQKHKDIHHDHHLNSQEGGRLYRKRSRSPIYGHDPQFSKNQRYYQSI